MKHIIIAFLLASAVALHAAGTPYSPDWANITPKRAIKHAEPDGDSLVKAVAALKPGDQLVIAAGTYSVERMWDIGVSGTAEAPIWIVAEDGAQVILTRPDDKQNVLNIGQGTPVHHLCLRGVEITGGSHGLRLGQCSEVWIDQCHIHHTGSVCLTANSAHTRRLFLTRNHNHHGGGHGEGMYLDANNGQFIMSESVIALNHIHDCKGEQGDGIEVKQGSWGNLIAENDIHDTQYPCITVYGTAGKPVNIIERNLCRRSADSAMQVQGEAIVRNNVLIGGKGSGFASTDHQGKSLNLQVIHNTIINTGDAFKGSSWNAREGMILANEAAAMKLDPENKLYWRMNRQRLDAEAMRDSLLAISGELTRDSGGPALVMENPENCGSLSLKGVNPPNYTHRKPRPSQEFERTIYQPVFRNNFAGPDRLRAFFDFVDPAMTAGQRNQTVVPTQTLFLLSNDLLRKRADVLADKLIAEEKSPDARLETLWLRVFNRPITIAERDEALAFLGSVEPLITTVKGRPALDSIQWRELCHSLLASNEFVFRL